MPVERDTVFRIASMSKPITSAAALMLLEEGQASRWTIRSPAGRPSFREMRVLRSPHGSSSVETDACGPARSRLEDLLTHRAGLTYGGFRARPASRRAYADDRWAATSTATSLPDDWIAGLAALPLIDQPGATLHYGHSTDLLGLLVARIEDAPLGDVLAAPHIRPARACATPVSPCPPNSAGGVQGCTGSTRRAA